MKFRFSILAILLLTAYAGALFAALTGKPSWWGAIGVWAPGLMLPCTPLLIRERRRRLIFSRWAGIAALLAVIVGVPIGILIERPDPTRTKTGNYLRATAIFMNVVLLSAIAGGTIAVALLRPTEPTRN